MEDQLSVRHIEFEDMLRCLELAGVEWDGISSQARGEEAVAYIDTPSDDGWQVTIDLAKSPQLKQQRYSPALLSVRKYADGEGYVVLEVEPVLTRKQWDLFKSMLDLLNIPEHEVVINPELYIFDID